MLTGVRETTLLAASRGIRRGPRRHSGAPTCTARLHARPAIAERGRGGYVLWRSGVCRRWVAIAFHVRLFHLPAEAGPLLHAGLPGASLCPRNPVKGLDRSPCRGTMAGAWGQFSQACP